MYGPAAFFDLNTTGDQATLANDLRSGKQCIVASLTGDGRINFDGYSFTHDTDGSRDTDIHCRVLFGVFIRSEVLTRNLALDGWSVLKIL